MFEGNWPWLPVFRAMTPIEQKMVNGFVLPATGGKLSPNADRAASGRQLGMLFEGFIKIPSDGQYIFSASPPTAGPCCGSTTHS